MDLLERAQDGSTELLGDHRSWTILSNGSRDEGKSGVLQGAVKHNIDWMDPPNASCSLRTTYLFKKSIAKEKFPLKDYP